MSIMTTPEIPNYIKNTSCKNFKGRIHQYPVDNDSNFLHLLTSNNPYSFEILQTACSLVANQSLTNVPEDLSHF